MDAVDIKRQLYSDANDVKLNQFARLLQRPQVLSLISEWSPPPQNVNYNWPLLNGCLKICDFTLILSVQEGLEFVFLDQQVLIFHFSYPVIFQVWGWDEQMLFMMGPHSFGHCRVSTVMWNSRFWHCSELHSYDHNLWYCLLAFHGQSHLTTYGVLNYITFCDCAG